ncbi:MAG: amidohydrolase family protein [Acidobacteria bacterium]|nr:amidohydrolase family protein [Acidobacteriota bacterium]
MSRIRTALFTVSACALLTFAACAGEDPGASASDSAMSDGAAVAFTGGRVIDGTGAAPIEDATLVIRDGLVLAVGPAASVQIPEGATRVDVSGKTITPGLINAHAHVGFSSENPSPPAEQIMAQLKLYADYGITTVYALGSDGVEAIKVRDAQEQAPGDGARLYTSGPGVTATTPEEGRQKVRAVADQRVNMVKTRLDLEEGSSDRQPPEVYQAIIDEAHSRGLRVAVHMFYLEDAKNLVEAGADILAHSIRDVDVDQAFIDELTEKDIGYIATLTRDLSVFVYETTPAFFDDPFFLKHIDAYRDQMTQVSDPALMERTLRDTAPRGAQEIKVALEQANRNLKLLVDGGAPVAFGTDTGASIGRWQGYFEHTEMALMAEAGLTPMQILVTATSGAAKVMRIDDRLGTLEPGKAADLLVVTANPLTDIRNMRTIESVWIAGQQQATAETN